MLFKRAVRSELGSIDAHLHSPDANSGKFPRRLNLFKKSIRLSERPASIHADERRLICYASVIIRPGLDAILGKYLVIREKFLDRQPFGFRELRFLAVSPAIFKLYAPQHDPVKLFGFVDRTIFRTHIELQVVWLKIVGIFARYGRIAADLAEFCLLLCRGRYGKCRECETE